MEILVDTHVHTVSSGHAYSTIDEITRFAKKQKLEAVAITDHTEGLPGGAHLFHFTNIRILPEYINDIRVIKGAEVNIIDYDGSLDLDFEEVKGLELIIASLHPPCIAPANKDKITNTIMKVIENPNVHIIGHPGDTRYPMDFEKIAKHAKEHHVLLEVNNSSLRPTSSRAGGKENLTQMLKWCKKYETSIVVASDSHFHEDTGAFTEAISLLKEVDFPQHLIANQNLNRLMSFIKKGNVDESKY